MFEDKNLLKVFLRKIHSSNGGNKFVAQIAEEIGVTNDEIQLLISKGWLQQTSFGLPDYRVADPILKKLNLKPHK